MTTTAVKYLSLASYDSNAIMKDMEEEEEKKEHSKTITPIQLQEVNSNTYAKTLKDPKSNKLTNKPGLTSEESDLIASQMYILSDKQLQMEILNAVLSLYPNLSESFSTATTTKGQASYLSTMVKKGYDMVSETKYNTLYNALSRHTRYGISLQCMTKSLAVIQQIVLKTVKTDELIQSSEKDLMISAWNKATDIILDLLPRAFTNIKKLKKHRNFIQRSMSTDDIKCVVTIWHKLIAEDKDKDKLTELLCKGISKHNDINIVFQRHSIDIFKQSSIIISMLDTTINQLSNTDELIPFLKRIGYKHTLMNIKPQLLAAMKKIILDSVREILSFNYTDDTKESWNRVLAFIIGIMIRNNSKEHINGREDSIYSTTISSSSGGAYPGDDGLDNLLTPEIIKNCQLSWQRIEKVIDRAVKIFYNNLCNCSEEIKQLFSKTNMVQQSQRLCKAIGSTVALLDETETMIPILIELGKRHVFYGVKPEHFKYLKKCWFNMLQQALSLSWNEKIKQSWQATWQFITYHMKTSLEDALLLYIPPDPIQVNFKVLINHIDNINLFDSSFYANIWFVANTGSGQNYKSHSYVFNQKQVNDKNDNSQPPFMDIRCLNALQIVDKYQNSHNLNSKIRYFEEDDSWFLRGNIIGKYSNIYKLHNYPFDMHNIEVIFALQVDDTIAMFRDGGLSVRLVPFKLNKMCGNNYNIYEPSIDLVELSAISGGSRTGRRYTHCKITIPISRKYVYYIYNVIIPLIIMQLIQFMIYFIELYPIYIKIIITLILLITLFVFKNINNIMQLPPTPYLTFLDYWYMYSYLLFIYHIIGLCVIYQLQNYEHNEIVNYGIAGAGFIIFIVINLYFYFKAKHFISLYPKQKTYKSGKDALDIIAKQTLAKSNSVRLANIDQLSN